MPIQLDKILADIAEEKPLHPLSEAAKIKKDQDEAWIKVGKKNKLSAHEAKSIFKVLQKKYEQEKLKPSSTWKLFQQMEDICKKQEECKPKIEEEEAEQEDESMVEFLEVREEDDDYEEDSDNQDKSMKSNNHSPTTSPDKETPNTVEAKPELKVLNSNLMVTQASTAVKPEYNQPQQKQTPISKALQAKGISVRKTNLGQPMKQTTLTKMTRGPGSENARSMLLPDSIKRKLQNVDMQREEATPNKKMNIASSQTSTAPIAQIPEVEIKKENIEDMETIITPTVTSGTGINVITIPSNNQTISSELSNGMTTLKSNGFNTQLEDLDFQKDIIFENNPSSSSKAIGHTTAPGEIINIGNFDNQLPPTFFKNLCNSNRHEALGLYVANVMNRVTGKTAAKLEINILKAIIEAQSDEMARL
ncbi:myb-like protein V [Episyrphus balteatus]|uniref:myb-like protein V n=1 Tax=Episyrphus balteatus TaxID=286459 RepID=UPI002486B233|nr:myb-like protein V [Episyrphus balteatus]